MGITHAFVNPKADGADTTITRPSDWNAGHVGNSDFALFVAASNAGAKAIAAADYVCDGTADEVQINAAITALGGPGVVRLSKGAFSIAAGIRPTSGCRIDGAGSGATTITVANAADVTAIYNADVAGGNTDIEIAHLAINGNRTNQTSDSIACVALQKVTRFRLTDLRLYDPREACISLLTAIDGKVSGCRLSGAGNDNFLAWTACANIAVSDCISSGTVGDIGTSNSTGFEVSDDSRNITFVNCISDGNNDDGFAVNNHTGTTGPFDVTFVGCTARGNGANGFRAYSQAATGPTGISFTGCNASGNQDGFRVDGADVGTVSLSGCVARANTRYGFVGATTDDVTLTGCVAQGNTSFGFSVPSGCDRWSLTNCVSIANHTGFNIVGSDSNLTGCVAKANTTGPGYTVQGNRNALTGCRSMSNSGASAGQGFDVSAGTDHHLTNCFATGNTKDGLLVRSATGVVVAGGRFQSNTTYGIRSLTGTDNLKLLGVQTSGNTTADRSLAAVTGLMVVDDFAANTVALGTAAAAGTAATLMRSDSTILAFDATVPVTQVFGDAAAAGSASVAARRDHRHGITGPVNLWVGPSSPHDMTATGTTFATANSAMLLAFQVLAPVTVTKAYCRVGVQSGNFDMGIYAADGTRLGSTGATAVPAAAVTVEVALTGSVALVPGVRYYASLACDNTTAGFGGYVAAGAPTIPGYCVRGKIATSYPLPTSIAVPTDNAGQSIGIWFA